MGGVDTQERNIGKGERTMEKLTHQILTVHVAQISERPGVFTSSNPSSQ